MLRISLVSLVTFLAAGCNCGGTPTKYTCTYYGTEVRQCFECDSQSAASTCSEVGPSTAGCDNTAVACP